MPLLGSVRGGLARLAHAPNSPDSSGYQALELTEPGTAAARPADPPRGRLQRHRVKLVTGLVVAVCFLAWGSGGGTGSLAGDLLGQAEPPRGGEAEAVAGYHEHKASSELDVITNPDVGMHVGDAAALPPGAISGGVRVGPRQFAPFYHGKCSSADFLASLKAATIRPDGRSRFVYSYNGSEPNEVPPWDGYEFSYDLVGCPPPHFFDPRQTCDLLNAFGGLQMLGDSLMRQFVQGVFLLLRNSFALVREKDELCAGNALLTQGTECKFVSYFDSREFVSVCDEETHVQYRQVWDLAEMDYDHVSMPPGYEDYSPKAVPDPGPGDKTPTVADAVRSNEAWFVKLVADLPERRRQFSPIFIPGTGMHGTYNYTQNAAYHVAPFDSYAASLPATAPQPIKLYSLALAPGALKPSWALSFQGPEAVKRFNKAMGEELDKANEAIGRTDPSKGGWAAFDWFGMTDGGESHDGTHYSYQVVVERAQMLLNLLDIVWGDVVAAGGLVDD